MKVEESKIASIKNWSPEDRPREKLLLKGTQALSDAELLAILLGTGTPKLNALDLAKNLLSKVDNSVNQLARYTPAELMKTKGIGEAKAITIVAALELGRRRRDFDIEAHKLTGSRDAFEIVKGNLMDLHHEEFWIILINRANKVIGKQQISSGGVAGTVADPKLIFKQAIENLASGIILAHNHPSGNLNPSQADIDLTKKIKEAGKTLEIQLLDHVIVAGQKYFSFADEGLL
jgi:DNA repair protein RadC